MIAQIRKPHLCLVALRALMIGCIAFSLILVSAIGLISTANSEELPNPTKEAEFLSLLDGIGQALTAQENAGVVYNEDLYNTGFDHGEGIQGTAAFRGIYDGSQHELYRFCADAGNLVEIQVDRTTGDMDPAFNVCHGVFTSTPLGGFSCSPLPMVGWADDNNGIPHAVGGFYWDPKFSFYAPASSSLPNKFTLAVFDFIGRGPSPEFEIHVAGVRPCVISVSLDVKPGSCPNPLNCNSKGVLPVAILGTADFDVNEIDPATVRLAGVAPLRWDFNDVATPYEPLTGKQDCTVDCTEMGPDGYLDATLKFDTQEVIAAIGEAVQDGACILAELTGNLRESVGGTEIVGEDVIRINCKGK